MTEAVFATAILILLAPMLAVTALAVVLTMPGSPVVRRTLPSAAGCSSIGYQFRTSVDGTTITKLGRFLRRTSIFMMPALIDVIRGELGLRTLLAIKE
jgi:lipopolysaccharide/colanic/teichoic acid biosynthesis glycosyltransferase